VSSPGGFHPQPSGDVRLASPGGDFEDCLFAQTSFGFARPIRSIDKEHYREFAHSQEERDSEQDHLRMTRLD